MSEELSPIFGKLFPLMFMMMGPIGVMPVFAGLTTAVDDQSRRRIAGQATLYAAAAVIIAVLLGASVLAAWGATPSSLMMASGILLMIAALRSMFSGGGSLPPADKTGKAEAIAIAPLAFPTIASPHAMGVLIIFVAYFPSLSGKAIVLTVALGVLTLDYVAMRNAERVMLVIGMTPLRILGAVFGVLQVALALEMIVSGLVQSKLLGG